MEPRRPKPARKTGKSLVAPALGTAFAEILEHEIEDVKLAVERAKEVQSAWAALPYPKRAACAKRSARWIYENADRLAETIARCTGKTRVDALSAEVLPSAMAAKYYARAAGRFLRDERLPGSSILFFNKRSVLTRVPYGVVGIITPWNYPFSIPLHEVLTALLAGNGVVLKVATQAQPVGLLLEELIDSSGFPEGLFHLLHLPGGAAGTAFLDSGIGKLFFTGSGETGRLLMAEAGKRLLPVNLELGGNDAMIVLRDANLRRAASGAAWAGLANSGQSCGGVQRIYVEEAVYAEFLGLLKKEVEALRQDRNDEETDLGAFTTKEQKILVDAHVAEALAAGAVLAASSRPLPGEASPYFSPARVLSIDPAKEDLGNARLLREESFGPVLTVQPVKDADEAVRRANDSVLGLTASVWTSGAAEGIVRRLEAGVVTVNDHLMTHGMAETPWGGFKQSGIGRSHGRSGIEDMTQVKTVVRERLPFMAKNLWWYPHGRKVYAGLKGALDFLFAPELGAKLRGGVKLAGLFLARFFGK